MTGLTCSDCPKALAPNPRRKGSRCRPCLARHNARSPAKQEKCREKMKLRLADPVFAAVHRERTSEGRRRKLREDPAFAAACRDTGQRLGRSGLGHDARPAGSESRLEAGRKRRETLIAWCPPSYRSLYRELKAKQGVRSADARAMVLAQIAEDQNRLQRQVLPQAEFVRVREAARYLAAREQGR